MAKLFRSSIIYRKLQRHSLICEAIQLSWSREEGLAKELFIILK